jgi:hypothetical protein
MTKLFTPTQVALIAWLATPGAAALVLAKNFDALGNRAAAMRTTLLGGLFLVWYFYAIFFYQPGIHSLIHIAAINAAHQIAVRYQMSGLAISLSKEFDLQSDEMVAGVTVGFLIAIFVLFLVVALALGSLGVPIPDECP